jgi:hypothetical protein
MKIEPFPFSTTLSLQHSFRSSVHRQRAARAHHHHHHHRHCDRVMYSRSGVQNNYTHRVRIGNWNEEHELKDVYYLQSLVHSPTLYQQCVGRMFGFINFWQRTKQVKMKEYLHRKERVPHLLPAAVGDLLSKSNNNTILNRWLVGWLVVDGLVGVIVSSYGTKAFECIITGSWPFIFTRWLYSFW